MNRIEREKQTVSTQPITLIHLLAKREDIFSFRQQSLLFWRKKNKFSPNCAYIARGMY